MKNKMFAAAGLIGLSLFVTACAEETAPVPAKPINQPIATQQQNVVVSPVVSTTQQSSSTAELTIKTQADQPAATNVKVSNPLTGSIVKSPLKISGTAQNWYFEGTFPVRIEDDKGKVLVSGQAHATEEWTKGGWIPFVADLEFNPGTAEKGKIILENDNPSGLPENHEAITMDVKFK